MPLLIKRRNVKSTKMLYEIKSLIENSLLAGYSEFAKKVPTIEIFFMFFNEYQYLVCRYKGGPKYLRESERKQHLKTLADMIMDRYGSIRNQYKVLEAKIITRDELRELAREK